MYRSNFHPTLIRLNNMTLSGVNASRVLMILVPLENCDPWLFNGTQIVQNHYVLTLFRALLWFYQGGIKIRPVHSWSVLLDARFEIYTYGDTALDFQSFNPNIMKSVAVTNKPYALLMGNIKMHQRNGSKQVVLGRRWCRWTLELVSFVTSSLSALIVC